MNGQGNLQAIRQLFEILVPLNSSVRKEYLASHPELPAEVVAQAVQLLRTDEDGGSLPPLDTILPDAGTSHKKLQPGDMLGPYRLVRLLGSGGMGVVYEAVRQEGDICLRTAIKLLHPELCTPEFLQHLRQEVSILASLSHPDIARLFDWKLDESDDSFFVLEYVEGETLTKYCRARLLDTRARLQLFLDVCSAVFHAHQHLIAHLDLKPGNIFVNTSGEVKLLDFGVARTLAKAESEVRDSPLHAYSSRYASPEQMSGGPVSALSDVYSLGIVLRELLTDASAAPGDESAAAPPGRELKAIVARASAEEPAARYASVDDLRQDILRLLAMRPVQAVPQTRFYLLNCFCHRNAWRLIALLVVASMLIAASAAWYMHREERMEHMRAEHLQQSVHQLSSTILFPLEDEMRNLPGATPARMLAVQTGLQFLKSLADEGNNDPKLMTEIAEAYLKLGDIQGNPANSNLGDEKGARESFETARRLVKDNKTAEGRYIYGVVLTHEGDLIYEQGDKRTAARMYEESIRVLSALNSAGNGNIKVKESLGLVLNDLGDQQSEEGHDELARPNYDKALGLAQELLQMKPDDLNFKRELARCYSRHGDLASNAGNWQQAANAYRGSFDIYERLLRQYPDNLKVQHSWIAGANNVALSDENLNRLDEALDLYTRVGQREARAVALDPSSNMALRDQEIGYSNLTRVLLRLNRLTAAEDSCRHELAIAKKLWNQNQQSAEAIDDLSGPEEHLAEIESKKHHDAAAVADEKLALDLLEENLRNSGSVASLAGVIDGLVRVGNYELDLAAGTPSAADGALKAVSKAVDELHHLESRLGPGSAEYAKRIGSIHALEERLRKLRQR